MAPVYYTYNNMRARRRSARLPRRMNCKEDKPMKHTMKKLAALLLALVMVLALTTVTAFAGTPAAPVPYLDADGVEQSCATYTDIATDTNIWTAGWYVVKENVTIANGVTFSGDVRLILCDGATLTIQNPAKKGYGIQDGGVEASLTIYAQSTGDAMGALNPSGKMGSIINYNGPITINGGHIIATGVRGIYTMVDGPLTINGGRIESFVTNAAGLYGLRARAGGLIINGGDVTASTVAADYGALGLSNGGTLTLGEGMQMDAGADKDSAQPVEGYNKEKWVHIYAIPQPEPTPEPAPVYREDVTPSAALTVTSEIGTIARVTVDGKEVDSKYYFVSGNSVVLSDAFMRSLANGSHTIRLYDGVTYATATWTVSGNTIASPKTSDPGVAIYGLLAVSATLGLGYMGKKRKED